MGLTGGIASGKSSVCKEFARLGAMIIDADEIAREVVEPGGPAYERLRKAFGSEFFDDRGRLKRAELAALVFSDRRARERLEEITHPVIVEELTRRIERARLSGPPGAVVIADIPLLYEKGLEHLVDAVIVVYADPHTRLERLRRRDHLSLEQARARFEAQMDLERKRSMADYVIDNSGDLDRTRLQVERLWRRLVRRDRNEDRSGSS